MNILIYGTLIGPGGITHHTREFTKRLSKLHNVKFKNFNVPIGWDGVYSPTMYSNLDELDSVHHTILHQQSLWTPDGNLMDYPLSGYDSEFIADIHLVMAEANHHYYYHNRLENSEAPVIAYFPWETSEIRADFFNHLLTFTQVWIPSKWQYDIMVKQGFPEFKLRVVPEGVDSSIFYPKENTNYKFTFLHIGTWEYRKSTYEICKAFIDEYGNNPNVQLRLSIHNKFRDQNGPVETFTKYGLPITDNIVLLDTLSESDYISEIRNADVYISCARGEGWNLPLIQSMASGVPSIWSKVGGQLQFADGAELGCDCLYETPVNTVNYINGEPWVWVWGQGFPGNLYEPDYTQLSKYIKDVYSNYSFYKKKALEFSDKIRENFDWDVSVETSNKILNRINNGEFVDIDIDVESIVIPPNVSNVYYLIHSVSFGDTLASTPTLRYLSQSHGCGINVVTHNPTVFNNNPYVQNVYSFDDFEYIHTHTTDHDIIYQSFTSAGKQDERGVEKKFGHIDIRQLHAIDLGFQLSPENLHCEFYPNTLELDINLPKQYVVLHITNNWPNRTWKYENWKELIQWLSDNKIFTVLIGFGHKESVHHSISTIPLEKQCPSFDNLYGLDLTNKGTMSDMWHVINRANCIVTMDTGPLHLAGTTDTHIIQLGSAIHPSFRAPYRNGSQNYKYNYVSGDCNLFCNSNLLYNVKEWNHINAVPPQTGCLENYTDFKCHPSLKSVIDVVSQKINIPYNILIDVKWNGNTIEYNFSKNLDKPYEIVIRDSVTRFKMYSIHENTLTPTKGYYWVGLDPDKKVVRDVDVELYIEGILWESCFLKRGSSDIFYIDDILIDNDLLKLELKTEDYYMIFYEIFLKNTYNQYGISINKGDVVLDVGANVGFFTLYSLMEGASKVVSVEPSYECYTSLQRLSNVFKKIQPINYAVYDGTDVEFNLNIGSSPGNYISNTSYVPKNINKKTVTVHSISINELLNSISEPIDLMKLDCEGSEEIIIDTIDLQKLKQIPKLIIEAHTTEIKDKIETKLKSNGYIINVDVVSDGIYMMYCIRSDKTI